MDSIERAIRNAFAKADAHTPATRQRIYESAWGAHERALMANTKLTDAQKEQRRQRLKDAISSIEQEFSRPVPQGGATELSVGTVTGGEPEFSHDAAESAPALDNDDIRGSSAKKKRARADLGYEGGISRSKKSRRRKRHSPFYSYGIPALVLFVAVAIGYSLYSSFVDLNRGPSSNPLRNDFSMEPLKNGESGGVQWISIFKPSEATRLSVQGRATAEIMQDGTRSFARVKSSGANDTVTFDVGEGVLDQLVGKKATFDIIAKADGGKATQVSVNCDFAGLGDCGRRRYDVNETPGDFLFDLEIPDNRKAGAAGVITINSDLSGTGKPVDIYEIRVSTNAQ